MRLDLAAAHWAGIVLLQPWHKAIFVVGVAAGHGEGHGALLHYILAHRAGFQRLLGRRGLFQVVDGELRRRRIATEAMGLPPHPRDISKISDLFPMFAHTDALDRLDRH